MGLEGLSQMEIFDGIVGLIYAVVGILVGALIASKYAKFKRRELFFIGVALIMSATLYLSIGLAFILYVFFNMEMNDTLFIILYLAFAPIFLLFWMWGMAILLAPDKIKYIVPPFFVIYIIYQLYMLYAFIVNPDLIAVRISRMKLDVAPIVSLYSLLNLIIVIITMSIFITQCFRSENPRIIWKGRFLLISTVMLVTGGFIIVAKPDDIIIILITRILFIGRTIFSYLGWILPERVAKWLIKEKE